MPDDYDAKALEYGVLLAGIAKKKEEAADLDADIETKKATSASMGKQIDEAEAAFSRLHDDVVQTQIKLDEMKKMKTEEFENEDRRLAAERASLAADIARQTEILDAVEKREENVTSRENKCKDREKELDSKSQALSNASFQLEEDKRLLGVMAANTQALKKATELQLEEAGKRLKEAKVAESAAKTAQEDVTVKMKKMNDDMLAAANDRRAAEDNSAKTAEKLRQVKDFCAVADEHVTYIAGHIKNPDGILNHFATKWPEIRDILLKPNPPSNFAEPITKIGK